MFSTSSMYLTNHFPLIWSKENCFKFYYVRGYVSIVFCYDIVGVNSVKLDYCREGADATVVYWFY